MGKARRQKLDVRYVFFDLMETLLDFQGTQPAYWLAMAVVAEDLGLMQRGDFLTRYADIRSRVRAGLPEHREFPLQQRLLAMGVAAESAEILVNAYMDYYTSRTRLMPGAVDMLDAWFERVPLAVVSNFFVADMPEHLCRHLGIQKHFQFIVDSTQVGWRKPHASIYEAALGKAGLNLENASDVIFVGDNFAADVAGPVALGFQAAHYGGALASGVSVIDHWSGFRP